MAGPRGGRPEEFVHVTDFDDPVVAVDQGVGGVRPDHGAGVAGRRAPSRLGSAAAQDDQALAEPPRPCGEPGPGRALRHGLQVGADHLYVVLFDEGLGQFGDAEIGLVPGTEPGGQAEAALLRHAQQRASDRAALPHVRGAPPGTHPRAQGGGERGRETRGLVEHAHAVRPEQPDPVDPGRHRDPVLEQPPPLARLGVSRGVDDRGAHAGRAAVRKDRGRRRGGHHDQGQVHRTGNLGERRIAGEPGEFPVLRVHRVDAAGELEGDQVAEDRGGEPGPGRGADHGDRAGPQEGSERIGRRRSRWKCTFVHEPAHPFIRH